MFLKRIDSVGFKSFAERISVEFVPGVTAVVGPNGSGKSNITDAIRWVLGEQSARSLRGSKMEDIIFQGSDTRKPLNVAEVTLILDNTDQQLPIDYQEVSVTRRVYRSGESEFLINKQACRLKDIVDLFMDSGLGREAFSIISQGKVEEILSSKSEERRVIFEEAAGVLKYKNRKKKAEYKLAETQENLNRIEDIIYEIESQLDPLKEQAAVAKDYLEKKDELTENEVSLLVAEIEMLHDKWKTLLAEIDQEKNKEIELKTTIQSKEAKLEKEKKEIQSLDEQVEEMQETLLELTKELESLEGNKKLVNERYKHFEENKTKLKQEKKLLETKIAELTGQLENQQSQLEESISNRDATRSSVKRIENKLNTTEENIIEQIEELKSEYIERLNEQAANKNELQSINKQVLQLEQKKDQQDNKFQGLISERKSLDESIEQLRIEVNNHGAERKKTEDELDVLKKQLEKDKSNYQELQTKLYQGYQYIEKLKSKKEMFEDMKEDFQGFFQGVKEILKAREENLLRDIHGAVIELIDVPNNYITAIETALGGQAQHIVVKDESAAREAIHWLKQTKKGRATFLPLTALKSRYIAEQLLSGVKAHSGYIGVASDVIQFNVKYQSVIQYLLGNVVIAENLKAANEIAIKLHRRYRVVTLDGDVVNPGGSMSGGSQKKTNQSLFTREKDLQDICEKLVDFEQKAQLFEQKVQKQKNYISQQEVKMEQLRSDIRHKQEIEQQAHSRLMEKEVNLSHLNDTLSMYDQERTQYEEDSKELKERQNVLNNELEQLFNVLTEIQNRTDELTQQQAVYQQNQKQLQTDYHQLEIKLAEQESEVKNLKEKTSTIELNLNEANESLEDVKKQLTDIYEFQKNGETEEEIEQKLLRIQKEKSETVQIIQAKRTERAKRTELTNDTERELKEQNRMHQSLLVAIQDKEVKANRIDVELENQLNHLQSEYLMTFEKAKQSYPKAEDIGETKRVVKLIKRAIDELGTVNLGAIDEYERIEERYQFLSEQRADLDEAKETLYGVIAEMDEEMKNRFDTTFHQIKEEFTIVFQQLFGGGRAELKLTDPTNLLETGVDIVAQPPGKKLQHLGLLSGGERALTAIALLFSILRIRPVPFCVLDEVEAALDEANVVRFARYLKKYSDNTQFIVITHRKGTMEEADVLYGVTMQESGVSRLVSVKLEETKNLIKQ